jgi:hypothetical protein
VGYRRKSAWKRDGRARGLRREKDGEKRVDVPAVVVTVGGSDDGGGRRGEPVPDALAHPIVHQSPLAPPRPPAPPTNPRCVRARSPSLENRSRNGVPALVWVFRATPYTGTRARARARATHVHVRAAHRRARLSYSALARVYRSVGERERVGGRRDVGGLLKFL